MHNHIRYPVPNGRERSASRIDAQGRGNPFHHFQPVRLWRKLLRRFATIDIFGSQLQYLNPSSPLPYYRMEGCPISRVHLVNCRIEVIVYPMATQDCCRIPSYCNGTKNFLRPLPLWMGLLHSPARRLAGSLLLTYYGASVPRYDSAFHLAMSEVRAKHFRQDAANAKNLTLCNQKYRLFFYLLGKCFAPTSVGRITREPDAVPVPSSQFLIPNQFVSLS